MALRTFAGLVVCLAIAGAIGLFVGLHYTADQVQTIVGQEMGVRRLAGSTLAYLLTPYTAYAIAGSLAPIVAWAAGGFVGGLITKSPLKGAIMGILAVVIAWVSFTIIAGSMAGLNISQTFQGFAEVTESAAADLAVAGVACIIPAVIGGAITQSGAPKVIIQKIGIGRE